jgi:hypothetical protein
VSRRVYVTKFDHDEARARHAAGEKIGTLAREYGVAWASVGRVVDPAFRAKFDGASYAWIRAGVCPDCGGPATRLGKSRQHRCMECSAKALATTARDGELQCSHCHEWKPDASFPRDRSHKIGRRGRHASCRACQAELRRRSRHARRVPCVNCGGPASHPDDSRGRTGLCFDCSRRRQWVA